MPLRQPQPTRFAIVAIVAAMLLAVVVATPVTAAGPSPSGPPAAADAIEHLQPLVSDANPLLRRTLAGTLAGIADASRAGRLNTRSLGGLVTESAAGQTRLAISIQAQAGRAAGAVAAIRAAGGRVANQSGDWIEAYIPATGLDRLAASTAVLAAEPILRSVPSGTVGAGVALQGADVWQANGFTGAGVKIGIIDGGFVGIAGLLGQELPATVKARCYSTVGSFSSSLNACQTDTDHGTAVAETIFDMAPGAALFIANPLSLQDYLTTVTWMTSNGVKIINASFGVQYEGPGDGTDPTGHSLYTVINQAVKQGALWVNAAGNSGESGWVGPWVDADGNKFLDFTATDEGNTFFLSEGDDVLVTMRWNDVWGKSANDYDLYLYGPGSADPVAASTGDQNGHSDPVETLDYVAPASGNYYLGIARHSGAAVSRIQLLMLTEADVQLQYQTKADTLTSPADSANPGELTVGAVDVASPTAVETYSSRGPTVDGRVKPEIVATDCDVTVTYDQFCGTSQSTPFASGAAALVLQANPTFTPTKVVAFLKTNAVPLSATVPNNAWGFGRLSLGPPPGPPPAAVAFAGPLAGAAEDEPLAVQPIVNVVDAKGHTVTTGAGATATVTLAVGVNPAAGTLTCSGGLSRAAVAGVATFSGCAINHAGTGYTLIAKSSGLASGTSSAFDVAIPPPPVPTKLTFGTQPAGGTANVVLGVQPVIAVTDLNGVPVTSGAAATQPITLGLATNPGSATLSCAGGLTKAAVAGVATFTGCSISAAGSGYTITANGPASDPVTSSPFDVAAGGPPATLTFQSSAVAITWGQPVTLTATLTSPAASAIAVAGRSVRFEVSRDGVSGWQAISTATTNAAGGASLAYRPATNLFYRIAWDGAPDLGLATSATVRVTVRQTATIRPASTAITRVAVGARTTFTATVRPARADVPPGSVRFQLYHRVAGHWLLTRSTVVASDAAGRASLAVTWSAGSWYVRASANPTGVNANSVWTAPQFFNAS